MKLKAFGGLAIINGADATADPILQRRQLALLAVLAAEGPAGVTRDRLLFLFWPDKSPEKARHALDQLLYITRRELGPDALVQGPTTLQLNPTILPSDVAEFGAALARNDLEAAVNAYGGPFLDGVHIPDAPEFERWSEGRRAWFENAFVQALSRLAAHASAAGDFVLAAHRLRRAATSEPLNGAVMRALMLALAHGGNASAALDVARRHVALVRDELGTGPDPAVSELMTTLQSGALPAPVVRCAVPDLTVTRVPVDAAAAVAGSPTVPKNLAGSRAGYLGVLTLAVGTLVLLGALAAQMRGSASRHGAILLEDRRQVTTLGTVLSPALSPDGAYLAYVTRQCAPAGCTFGIDIQEVGSRATRHIVRGVSLIEYIGWSPDRRNLMVGGTLVNGKEGLYLVSALGGTPRFVSSFYFPAFFAGGDSLLLTPSAGSDSVYWLRAAGLDGVPGDSLAVPGPGIGIPYAMNVPGTSWFIVQVNQDAGSELRVIDRSGRETDRRSFPSIELAQASRDALWFSSNFNLMRVPFDTARGRFGTGVDTAYVGLFTGFDVTADGRTLLIGEATESYDVWALPFDDMLRGEFAPGRRLAHGSARFAVTISPDGKRLLVARATGVAEAARFHLSTMPFDGGTETPVRTRGLPAGWTWMDSTSIVVDEVESGRAHAVLIDVPSGERRAEFTPPDSALACCPGTLPGGGWIWTPRDEHSVKVQLPGERAPHVFPAPPWYQGIWSIGVSPDGQYVLYTGKSVCCDSLRLSVLSLRDSTTTTWWTGAGIPVIDASWLPGGEILLAVSRTPDNRTFYRLRSPGIIDSLGTIPRPTWAVDVSLDMKHAIVSTHEYQGDGWMYTVVRR